MPVVIGASDSEGQVFVVSGGKKPTGEAGKGRKAHRTKDAAGVHVLHPLVDVVATWPHLVESGRVDAVLLLGPTGDSIKTDVGDDAVIEGPDVVTLLVGDDLGGPVGEPRG